MKRTILMSLGFQPVAELVPGSVRGLTRIRLGSVEFVRRADLGTDVSEVWMELPRDAIQVPDKNVVRWFD